MKRFVRCVCLIITLSLLFTIPSYAAESRAIEASSYFTRTNAYLSKVSGNTFYIIFEVLGTGTMETIGASYIELQSSSDNSNWGYVTSYSKSNYSNMTASNTVGHDDYFTYTGTTNMYYRAYVEFYAKDDTGSSYYSTYTPSIRIP